MPPALATQAVSSSPMARRRRSAWLAVVAAATAFTWCLVVSLSQWWGGNVSSFDLGLFAQVAQSWSAGGPPYSRIRGLNVLGEHFSPVLALLGPAWAAWPDPRVLLVVQALLLALAVGILTAAAARRLRGPLLALYVVVVLLGYGLLAALTFDFHEVAFAPVFVVLLGLGLLRDRLAPGVVGALGLVLVKEDLGLTVLVAAATWWFLRRRDLKAPLVLGAIGVAGLVTAYSTIYRLGPDFGSYLTRLGSDDAGASWSSVPLRLVPVGAFLVATCGVGLRSPVVVLALPTLAWRLASSTTSYWTLDYHYDLVLWAIAALALADRLPVSVAAASRGLRILLAVALLANLALGLSRFAGDATPLALLRPSPVLGSVERLTEHLPQGSAVAAQDRLAPYLIPRNDVSALDVRSDQQVAFVLLTTDGSGGGENRAPLCARLELVREAADEGWSRWADGPVTLVLLPSPRVPPLHAC